MILLNVLRYLIFIPIAFGIFWFIDWLLLIIFNWFLSLKLVPLLIILFIGSGVIFWIFIYIAGGLVLLSGYICPNKKVSFWVLLVITILNAINLLYVNWSMDIEYSGLVLTSSIVFTIIVISLTFAMILGIAHLLE